ncbi:MULTISPECIES: AI-2E family transporter [unclassified Bartonella]|uniref:AI-2E family transporter n=1 Tax=unclassified Bartonella TaxID=2645622 RepID=UPI0021CAD78D|nr:MULTISPECIES: AI-2E family transporter [unclassified Bartonella]UXN04684.1 AI-2E family transporter [Bartonella sp. HY406]UXN07723.1 AI-2E family transporter [Bartonella sp. HY761]
MQDETQDAGNKKSDEVVTISASQLRQLKRKERQEARALRSKANFVLVPLQGNVRKQAFFWLGTLLFFIMFLIVFSDVLLPFVAGIALAYFLNPVVEFLEKVGFSRMWATVAIVIFVVVIFALAIIILVPLLAQQLAGFASNIPSYIKPLREFLKNQDLSWLHQFNIDTSTLQGSLQSLLDKLSTIVTGLFQSLWDSGRAIVNVFILWIMAPVVAFYMLLDWDRMVDTVDSWIPRDHLSTIRSIFAQMDRAVAGFIRGQGSVCLILGCYYAIGLTISGLNFGLLIGLFVGFISFIPYVGSAIGLLLAVGMAAFQYWPDSWGWIVVVACLFFVGQFVEGYILQPKLVGSSVGLHPVWLMFALFAFGAIFGFTGMLIAVPAAAAVGVLVRFALHTYLESPVYKGNDGAERGE